MKRVVFLVLVALLAGLQTGLSSGAIAQSVKPKPLYELQSQFSEADFTWSQAKGSGVIAGQGYLRAEGGFIRYAGGEAVTLVPRTAYTDEIVSTTRQPGFFDQFSNIIKDPNYNQYRRVVTADAEGRFRFEGLPAGEWYVVTRSIWFVRDKQNKTTYRGGLMWGQINIGEGEKRENVKLTSLTELAR